MIDRFWNWVNWHLIGIKFDVDQVIKSLRNNIRYNTADPRDVMEYHMSGADRDMTFTKFMDG